MTNLMKRDRRRVAGALAMLALWLGSGPLWAQKPASTPGPVSDWQALIPKDWDPSRLFRNRNPATIREGSASELEMMRQLREAWDNAPVRDELQGARMRLPGYIVPLDAASGGRITQFLLVPYFGACIHSPPPPANQIVHVTLKSPGAWRAMDAVWVSGTLTTQRQESSMGMSGYAVSADRVERYRAPAQ